LPNVVGNSGIAGQSIMHVVIARGACLCLLAAACGDPARVRLVSVEFPDQCGRPDAVNSVRVIAYTPGGEIKRSDLEISDFPVDTMQIGVEAIVGGGARGAIGKTGPIDFANLADGAVLPIAMVPPDGFCRVGDMSEARAAPQLAHAGDGVLVVGGGAADYYDPATGTFTRIAVPAIGDLTGGVLAELPNGNVILSGTNRGITLEFDARQKTFTLRGVLDPQRAFHGAVALDDDRYFLIGGCSDVDAAGCGGVALRSSFTYSLTSDARAPGPSLPAAAVREGATLFATGDGTYVLAGGFGDAGAADRFSLDAPTTTTLTGLAAEVTPLDGGALLSAFAPDGGTASSASAVITPDGAVVPMLGAPPRAGARLVLLEDGSVVAIGGGAPVAKYIPTTRSWLQLTPPGAAPALTAPGAIRLRDGSVLVVGGTPATTEAWLYRPSLVGPQSAAVTALPVGTAEGVLTAPDPRTTPDTGRFTLHASDAGLAARALVGGPRAVTGSVAASLRITKGGFALFAQQTSPGRALVAELRPGEPARIERLAGGSSMTLCSGRTIADVTGSHNVSLAVADQTATLSLDDLAVASCDVGPGVAGQWGVAAVGVDAELDVVTIAVTR
jgi:hypothetical protein